jgi:hypothetical protein
MRLAEYWTPTGRAVRTPNDKEMGMEQYEDEERTETTSEDSRRIVEKADPPRGERQMASEHASDGEALQLFE